MKLRVIFEKNDHKIASYLPGRKLKGEGWRILYLWPVMWPVFLRGTFIGQCQLISLTNAQERRYILSRMPLLCERIKRLRRFPLRQTLVVARERKVERQKNLRTSTVCGRIVWSKIVIVQSGRSQVLVCIVFTAHGPSRRTTLLFLITLITKSRIIVVYCVSGVFLKDTIQQYS